MADIPYKVLASRVKEIVASSDHNTLTVKRIRLQLENEFGLNLADRKAEIQTLVDKCLVETAGDDQANHGDIRSEIKYFPYADNNGSTDARGSANFNEGTSDRSSDNEEDNSERAASSNQCKPTGGSDSNSDSQDEHDFYDKPPRAEKRAKADRSAATKSRRSAESAIVANEEDDAEVARRLSISDVYGLRRTRAAPSTAKRKPVASKRESGEKGTSGFQKPVRVSEQLAALLGGEQELSRPEIVKRLWNVVRERQLLDERNKQFAVCDAQLAEIFGRTRVRMFGMMKLLKRHITPI